jgi:hypothetical protein
LLLLSPNVKAYPIFAATDKIVYAINDNMTVSGTIDTTNSVSITITIYTSTGSLMNSLTTLSSGGTPNTFSISTQINSTYSPGDYFIIVSDGADSINISFRVVSKFVMLSPYLIKNSNIISISTESFTDSSNPDLGEIVNLSQSTLKKVFNGSADILGKNYYFAVVDERFEGSYDTLYIDDDQRFQIYNAAEDTGSEYELEKMKRVGEGVRLNNSDFIVTYIEFPTGKKVLLNLAIEDSVYSPYELVHFIVLATNSTGHLLANEGLEINLLDSTGEIKNSTLGKTNSFGYFVWNFSAPPQAGSYIISVNQSLGIEFFSVEVFTLSGKITDLANTPLYTFAPNPDIRITAILRDSAGDPIETAKVSATLTYPNGTVKTYVLTGGNGTWSYDLSLEGAPTGRYSVKIIATVSGNKQEFLTGFSIEAVILDVVPINVEFIEEAEGPEALVNAFAPNKNVTLFVALSNVSAGGLFARGPEGLIDIDNPTTAIDECNTTVRLVELKDDRGVSWINDISYQVMNLSRTLAYFQAEEGPPPMMLRQCMIIFTAPSRAGVYRAEVKVSHRVGEALGGSTFGIQRLYASANPVDFKGEDFWFYAPNSSIRIKIKVTDLETRNEIPSTDIIDARILEMYKEWPSFEDVLTAEYKPDESIINGTLNFTTPNSEGFFRFIFKFKANLSGVIEEGVGTGFFMLKKYFIWGEPVCPGQFGPCIFSPTQNITITVRVVDVSQGTLFGTGQNLSCTGCDGLEIGIQRLVNHQVFKELVKNTDYSVINGSVRNGVGNVTIVIDPSRPLPSGWYGIDLLLTDPADRSKQYFGWAGLNFWVETIPVFSEDGNLTASWRWQPYGVNQPVAFAVIARDPEQPPETNILPISDVEVESLRWMNTWPPLDLPFEYEAYPQNVRFEWDPANPQNVWVVNITSGSSREGYHQANVKVTTSKGTDIGTHWFEVSSFLVEIYYRGMYTWPPVYSWDENLTLNITAYDFDFAPHNLSEVGTKAKSVWDIRTGRAIKVNSSTSCNQNNCTIEINLSSLISGEYEASIKINDTYGNEKEDHVYFVIRGLTVAIPTIEQAWIGYRDTPERELNVDNDRDFCDNERWLTYFNVLQMWCINKRGEWMGGVCSGEGTEVNVSSNSTHLWVIPPNQNYTIGENFTIPGDWHNWTVVDIGSTEPWFRVRHNESKICGSKWKVICTENTCEQIEEGYVLTPPSNYTNFYHGYVRNLIQELEWGSWFIEWFGEEFNQTRDVYIYHNTTHLWITNTIEFTGEPASVNESITDPYGGIWKVKTIDKNRVELIGQNVLAKTGAWINASLSKSGTIKIEPVREDYFGGWDPITNSWRGIDLDGDGFTNSTIYFAIIDSSSPNVYDRFFFSNTSNMSLYYPNGIDISGNQSERTFGNLDQLTLLSISPDANRITFYSNRTGEWADLGEFKIESNITIPVIVRSPSGTPEIANVSIRTIRKEVGFGPSQIIQLQEPYPNITNCDGLCEIVINVNDLNPPQTQAGRYAFEITASKVGAEERLEEWKWPHAMLRVFLVESAIGEGGYVNDFRTIPLYRYDWENYGEIPELYTINETGEQEIFGVLLHADQNVVCTVEYPTDADSTNFSVQRSGPPFEGQQYFGIDATNQTIYVDTDADCNFTDSGTIGPLYLGDPVNLTLSGNKYMLRVLEIRTTPGYNRTSLGVSDLSPSEIQPVKIDIWNVNPSPKWAMLGVNIGGVDYDVILANDTPKYPMCRIWDIDECVKKAWVSTTGNFSAVTPSISKGYPVLIGENFTSDLYLAKVGPGPWEGIIIVNFSEILDLYPNLPGLNIRSRDNTNPMFIRLSESILNLDLDKDGYKNDEFYMVVFDDDIDGLQNLTANIVDDDLNITEDWWQNFTANASEPGKYKDFYADEFGQREFRESLPRGMWYGRARFNETVEGTPWEYTPEWDIVNFNNTHMLLRKWRWQFNVTENVTIILKAYDFDLTPIANASVSFLYMIRFTPFGGIYMNATAPSAPTVVPVQNITDSAGFAILRLENGTWAPGDYMTVLEVESNEGSEIVYNWFRMEEL